MNNQTTGTIYLNNLPQFALWRDELTGQMSDGMWENSAPWEHYKFWGGLDVVVERAGTPRVATGQPWQIKKKGYAFNRLYSIVGDRMLALGRMARAAESLGLAVPIDRTAAEYMPPTMDAWRECRASGKWQYDFVKEPMERDVTEELALAFYAETYTMKDLRDDVAVISGAMKNVVRE